MRVSQQALLALEFHILHKRHQAIYTQGSPTPSNLHGALGAGSTKEKKEKKNKAETIPPAFLLLTSTAQTLLRAPAPGTLATDGSPLRLTIRGTQVGF